MSITEEYACPLTGDRPAVPCRYCHGQGRVDYFNIHGHLILSRHCPLCDGTGKTERLPNREEANA